MSVHTEEIREVSGFGKQIEASAMEMIFDNLQMYQYQYPERSTVRELVSNALDSVKEKQVALMILQGTAKEEDFFLRREEAVNKDSNFNPEYFNLEYLNRFDNEVTIDYYEGGDSERDSLVITDPGVGLGGRRLAGYFNLGYSTKRNSKFALGKFGIGAKAALSTGVDCYYMESSYNGIVTKWNVYSAKFNSLVPSINMVTGNRNEEQNFGPDTIYGEKVRGLNYTKIVIQVKKHKKQAYLDAVKSQLMYFDNVKLRLWDQNKNMTTVPTKADLMYEDEMLVVARNTIYTKPHIILNGVNYGLIDFKELELEDKIGNVGIKVPAEGVQVNPSRESVIWNDKTRATILEAFENAVGAATKMVAGRLQGTDYLEWLRTLEKAKGSIYNRDNDNDPLGVLSRIIDVEKVDFSFKPDPRLGSGSRSLWGVDYVRYTIEEKVEKKGKKTITKRLLDRVDNCHWMSNFGPTIKVIFKTGRENLPVRTIRYLLSDPDVKELWIFGEQEWNENFARGLTADVLHKLKPAGTSLEDYKIYCGTQDFLDMTKDKQSKKFLTTGREIADLAEIQASVLKHIKSSSRTVLEETIVVPADFKFEMSMVDGKMTETEEEVEEAKVVEKLTPEQVRRQSGRIYLRTPDFASGTITMKGIEPNLLEVDGWENSYYSLQGNTDQLKIASVILASVTNAHLDETYDKDDIYSGTTNDVNSIKAVAYKARPDHSSVHMGDLDDMVPTEKARLQEELNKLRADHSQYAPYYFTPPGMPATIESFKQPLVRLVSVAKDLVKKLPDNVRPIQEFFLSFTKDNQITMSNFLANWYLALSVKDTVEQCRKFTDSQHFRNHRIKLLTGRLGVFVNKHAKTNVMHLIQDNPEWYNELNTFMEKVLGFQQFVSLHKTEPELIAAQAKNLFGDPRIQGAVAFDMERYNEIAELQEYYTQAGHFLAKLDWSRCDDKIAQIITELSQMKGWEPWVFEAPYPIEEQITAQESTIQ